VNNSETIHQPNDTERTVARFLESLDRIEQKAEQPPATTEQPEHQAEQIPAEPVSEAEQPDANSLSAEAAMSDNVMSTAPVNIGNQAIPGLWTGRDLHNAVSQTRSYVVEDLISPSSVNLFVGDSGLGKSPLFFLLGICVATGHPFLNFKVTSGRVCIVDFENGKVGQDKMSEAICRFSVCLMMSCSTIRIGE
jgi:RecA-family ATPase